MLVVLPDEHDPEQPVIEAIRKGDRHAFGELARRHGGWVRGVIYGVLGDRDRLDDVAQQVWTNVWEQFDKLRNPARWRPWLYRLARNAAIDAGRQATRQRRATQRLAESRVECKAGERPADRIAGAETRAAVADAIRSLPALYREPFVLRHIEGWSYRRIGEVMSMPVDTVETRLVRARRLLREALRDKV